MNLFKKISINEIGVLLSLTLPLVLTGVVECSVGFFSTLFLAHLGIQELAAGAVVQWIFFTMMMIMWGTLCAVSVLIAHKQGENDNISITFILRDGVRLALYLVIPAFLILRHVGTLLSFAGYDATTIMLAEKYMRGLSWGLVPDFVGLVLMQLLIGLGHTRTNLLFTLVWVPLNILTNYALIFGKFGMPALGMSGIGWGTTLAYWIFAVILVGYLFASTSYRRYMKGLLSLRASRFLKEICAVGIPMGFMYCLEIAFFLALTLMMGHISQVAIAANQIIMQYLGEVSVVSFAVAQAVTVRMGHLLGEKKWNMAERAVYIGIGIALVFMLLVGIGYYCFPKTLIAIDFDVHAQANTNIIKLAVTFFAIAALFQLIEAVRIALFGALRSMKDTRYTLVVSLISFWFISLPVGYLLAVPLHWGGAGLWWGAVAGALTGVFLLAYRLHQCIHPAKEPAIKPRLSLVTLTESVPASLDRHYA